MPESDVLQRIRERAGTLVAQDLRGASIVLGHLRELILEAHGIGYRHKAIHASIESAGLQATWNTYKSCLKRMKKAADTLPASSACDAAPNRVTSIAAIISASTDASRLAQPVPNDASDLSSAEPRAPVAALGPTSSATRVLDALNEARRVASSRDYAQIGRDLYRKKQRDQRIERNGLNQSHQPKDPS
jgi:hypothetical protein